MCQNYLIESYKTFFNKTADFLFASTLASAYFYISNPGYFATKISSF